jgi:predicted metal-dependent hydrolase
MIERFRMLNVSFPVKILYKNIKHTYFKMREDGLSIHTSKKTPFHLIETYVLEHQRRFEETYEKYQKKEFILWGQKVDVKLYEGPFSYEIKGHVIHMYDQSNDISQSFLKVLSQESKLYLESIKDSLELKLQTFQIKPRPYQLKWYTSKFGSYHRNKDYISLNIYLATCEPSLFLYVLYHEYTHTIHFHHQNSFYVLLEKLCPNHKTYEKKLKSLVISKHYTL